MKYQIVILAAGKGKRMNQPDMPKVLLPFRGRPLVSHLLTEIQSLRLPGKPVVVVGFQKEKVMEALGPQYIYAEQTQQLGTGHAALSAKAYVEAQNILV